MEFVFYSVSFLRLARTMINAADTVVTAAITKTMAVVVSPVLAVSVLSELCGVLVSVLPDCSGLDVSGFDVSGSDVGSEVGSDVGSDVGSEVGSDVGSETGSTGVPASLYMTSSVISVVRAGVVK